MRVCDLKNKEVINICDCKRLGCIVDVIFDCDTGVITEFIIPGPGNIFNFFGREMEYIIPFCAIKQIGPDIILVDVKEEDVLQKCE